MPRHVTRWSKEELASVEAMWMEGKSAGLISLETGRPRSSIMGVVWRFGWKRAESTKVLRTNPAQKPKRESTKKPIHNPRRTAYHDDMQFIETHAEYSARKRRERQEARDAAK